MVFATSRREVNFCCGFPTKMRLDFYQYFSLCDMVKVMIMVIAVVGVIIYVLNLIWGTVMG